MKLGIMQPYFMPYIGYFQLINAVDKYVIYDDVQFIKGGWINRNNILLNNERYMFNLLLSGASSNKNINEVYVQTNQIKLIKTIESAYRKAPFFNVVFPVLLNILNYENYNLAAFLGNSIVEFCKYLTIKTEIVYSSTIEKDDKLKAQDKVINICQVLKAKSYLNAIGGRELYLKENFRKYNIDLSFLETKIEPYKQFNNEFIPYLSILDILMFNSIEDAKKMLQKYTLV